MSSARSRRHPRARVIDLGAASTTPSDVQVVQVEPDGGLTAEQKRIQEEKRRAELLVLMRSRIEVMDKEKAVARKPLVKKGEIAIDQVARYSAEVQLLREKNNLTDKEALKVARDLTEHIDPENGPKLSAAQQKRADRKLEAAHQAKLKAAQNRMRAAGMSEDEVARVYWEDVVQAENIANGYGAAVVATKREQAVIDARRKMRQVTQSLEVRKQMEEDRLNLIRKAMKIGSRPKHELKDEAYKQRRLKQLMGEAVEDELEEEEYIPDSQVIETDEQQKYTQKKKLRQLQVEWETVALREQKRKISPQKSAELVDAYVAKLRMERLARFEQLIQLHSDLFFDVMRGRFLKGIADLDAHDDVVNRDEATWRKGVRAFVDVRVPVESLLDFSYGWQTRKDVVTRTIEQASRFLEQAKNRILYDPERGALHKQHAEELIQRIQSYDPENEFVFCLTVCHDPGRKGQYATESFMSGTVHRDAHTHRDDIVKAGLSKNGFTEPPPVCANPECQAFCVSRERCKREFLPKCTDSANCREKGYVFCRPACLTRHREIRHSESEEAKLAQERYEKEQAEKREKEGKLRMKERKVHREIEAERGTELDPRPLKLNPDGTTSFFDEHEERVKRDLYRGFGFALDIAAGWFFDPNERIQLTPAQKELSKRTAELVAKRRRALAVAAAAGLETVESLEQIDHKSDA